MKKLAVLLGLILILVLPGCSQKEGNEEQESVSRETEADSEAESKDGEEAEEKVQTDTEQEERLSYTLTVDADTEALDESYDISDLLYGIFIEDINYAVDGGMYGELVKNGSFEYGEKAAGSNKHGWESSSENLTFEVLDGSVDGSSVHEQNLHYGHIVNNSETWQGIGNSGYLSGMAVTVDAAYKVSCFIKSEGGYSGSVLFSLEDGEGAIYAQATVDAVTENWYKYEAVLTPNQTVTEDLVLFVKIEAGTIELDMLSLFPEDTYKGRSNGIRADIGAYLEGLNPSFVRFPGGCLVEGDSLETMYSWKDSIGNGGELLINGELTVGDVAVRPLGINLWGSDTASENPYYMSYGMGFYEYFLLCEDLEALAVPVVNAGMSCPVQSEEYQVVDVNSEEFKQYVQDALDLVEFCRGGADTTWGAVRIAMGHEDTFDLKYIGIGNEQWQEEYYQHYALFLEAFKSAAREQPELYGDIELIVANGPVSSDQYAWSKIEEAGSSYAGLVDEHYYQTPQWFLTNTDRYDSYDRDSVGVFLGEYAAKSNTLEAALAEAAYMTGLEENADIVKMACYAPLFGNHTAVQWVPDLIWFTNDAVYGSVNYYVQKMFASNVGTTVLPSLLTAGEDYSSAQALTGKVGLGTWMTSAEFRDLEVYSNATGELLYSSDFESGSMSDWSVQAGIFKVEDGALIQSNIASPAKTNIGDVAYAGDIGWQNYTLKVKAVKTGGSEGFLIPIAVEGADNCIFWNLGGWGNTVSCLQIVEDGVKGDQVSQTVKNITLKKDQEYELSVELNNQNIRCYLDGELMIDYDVPQPEFVYQTSSINEDGDLIIKIVNVSGYPANVDVQLQNAGNIQDEAILTLLTGSGQSAINTVSEPELIADQEQTIQVAEQFLYEAPAYSVSIIKIISN